MEPEELPFTSVLNIFLSSMAAQMLQVVLRPELPQRQFEISERKDRWFPELLTLYPVSAYQASLPSHICTDAKVFMSDETSDITTCPTKLQ